MGNIKKWWKDPPPIWGTNTFKMKARLIYIKTQLRHWNKTYFSNIFQAKKELEFKMEGLQKSLMEKGYTNEIGKEELDLLKKLEERCLQEEILWK